MARSDRPPLSTVRARPHGDVAAAAPGGLPRRGRSISLLCPSRVRRHRPPPPPPAREMRCPHCYRLSRLVCSRALTARGRGARRRRAASDAVPARAAAGAQTGACGAAPAAAARHVGAPPRRCSPECRLLAVCVCVCMCVRMRRRHPPRAIVFCAGSAPTPVSAREGGALVLVSF